MRNVSKIVASLLLAACATGPLDGPKVNYFGTAFALRAVPTTLDPTPKTSMVGDLIWRQPYVSVREAVLTEQSTLRIPAGNIFTKSPGNVVFENGKILIELTGIYQEHVAFCDKDVSWASRNPIDGRSLRFCLVDEGRDGVFDYLLFMGASKSDDQAMFAHPITLSEPKRRVAIPYTVQDGQAPVMTLGMTVTRSLLGAYRVEPAALRDGEVITLDSNDKIENREKRGSAGAGKAAGTVFKPDDLPLTLSLNGASVEVLSAENKVIKYRVRSGFSDATLEVPYSGSLPIE